MNTEEVLCRVNHYLNDSEAKYAIMINGPWGCGKSYLCKEKIIPTINKNNAGRTDKRRSIYISLYGMTSTDALSKEVLVKFWASKSVNHSEKAEAVIEYSSGILSMASKAVSFSIKGASFSLDKLCGQITGFMKAESLVICFDDLERCAIPINELLGFVNNLIEHCDCKVILLADEKNIGKMFANDKIEAKYQVVMSGRVISTSGDNKKGFEASREKDSSGNREKISIEQLKELNEQVFADNYMYSNTKEKVVGFTINYTPNIQEIFENLISGLPEDTNSTNMVSYKSFLQENKANVVTWFIENQNDNLRIVKKWIYKFKEIYVNFMKEYSNNTEYSLDDCRALLHSFLEYSIWLICAIGKSKKLLTWSNNQITGFVGTITNHDRIRAYSFIDKWMIDYCWAEKEFIDSCRIYHEDKEREKRERAKQEDERLKAESKNALRFLSKWYYSESDEDIRDNIKQLLSGLANGIYELQDYPDIIFYLIILKHVKLYDESIANVVDTMKLQIEKTSDVHDLIDWPRLFEDETDQKEYEGYMNQILDAIKKQKCTLIRESNNNFEEYNTVDKFVTYCHENENLFFQEKSFFDIIELEDIIALMQMSNLKEKYTVIDTIHYVYRYSNVSECYPLDWKDLKGLLSSFDSDKMFNSSVVQQNAKEICVKAIANILGKYDLNEKV